MKKWSVFVLAGLIVLAGAIGASHVWAGEKTKVEKQNVQAEKKAVTVTTKKDQEEAKVLRKQLESLNSQMKKLNAEKDGEKTSAKRAKLSKEYLQVFEKQKALGKKLNVDSKALDHVISSLKEKESRE
ncbi:hypothetical protein SAMN04488137_1608 [Fictibacillus solisalsi]|uniref:Uncharacterized protein n=1 Tax=Fictibacillus solisalsi TaxID=459525 RepID=A0A1G9VIL4_9BACL|nr:hypothetical protein [Fictibacillus solisalsi]SDM71950.1 hypothetical protein SAMN04488137_1608 [Fictibacillus solisalsi]